MMYTPWIHRTFGVEVEMRKMCTTDIPLYEHDIRTALATRTDRLNGRVADYWHSDGRLWDIKTDASCGWEVASPALWMNGSGHNPELKSVLTGLKALHPKVDGKCGLHVHIDCSEFTWHEMRKLLILWARYEPFFFEMQPIARRNHDYCQPVHRNTWDGSTSRAWVHLSQGIVSESESVFKKKVNDASRRVALNAEGWWRHGRIEVRLHSGTIEYAKIRHWVMLMLAVVERAKHPLMPEVKPFGEWKAHTGYTTPYLGKVFGLVPSRFVPHVPNEAADVVRWCEARRKKFANMRIVGGTTQGFRTRREWQALVAEAQRAAVSRLVATPPEQRRQLDAQGYPLLDRR